MLSIVSLLAATVVSAPDRSDLRFDVLATPFDFASILWRYDDHPDGARVDAVQHWFAAEVEGRVAPPLRLGLYAAFGSGTIDGQNPTSLTTLVPRLGLDLIAAGPHRVGLSLDLQWPFRLALDSDPPQDGALGPLPWIEVSFGTTHDFAAFGVSSRVWPGDGRLAWASYGTWLSPTARLVVGVAAMARLTRNPSTTDALSGATVYGELDFLHGPSHPLRWLLRAELGYSLGVTLGVGFDWGRHTGHSP